jgi:hypothetical protein
MKLPQLIRFGGLQKRLVLLPEKSRMGSRASAWNFLLDATNLVSVVHINFWWLQNV